LGYCPTLTSIPTRMSSSNPPGLESHGQLQVYSSGGTDEWLTFKKTKLYTNAYVMSEGKILLGFKKRGHGKYKYNGFGGKVEPGETVHDAAVRELKEEAGIDGDLTPCGTFLYGQEGLDHMFQIELFRVDSYGGEPIETDEMRPEWFEIEGGTADGGHELMDGGRVPIGQRPGIPWDKLWESDKYWFPLLLSRQNFVGRSDFARSVEDGVETLRLQRWWIGTKDNST